MTSLRTRLLAWLLPPLLIVGVTAAGGAYVFMERRLTAAYDQDLGDIARTLVPYLRVEGGRTFLDVGPQAEAVLRADSADQIYYAVHDAQGKFITGDPALPSPPEDNVSTLFWDGLRQGRPIRAVAVGARVEDRNFVVLAAETTTKRERAYRDALVSAIAPVFLLSIAAVAAVIFGVRRGLGPVEMLREELQARSHRDLRAVDEGHVVSELRPLVRELNQMLSRLDEAQHTQSRFIANAAHQLRTPIAGLVTQLDLARGGGPDSALHLARAREGAARLARLARQILSLAAADPAANPAANDEACDLADIVKSHADTWLRAASAQGVELEFDLGTAGVHGNPILIGELAANLVDNATRYGATTVGISTRRESSACAIEVTDDGPGIPASERPRIFERFHRLDNQSTEGSGLGLAIVQEIAQRHRAVIDVADARNGHGTRIRVSFPCA